MALLPMGHTGRARTRTDSSPAIDACPETMPEAWTSAMRPRGNVFGRAMGKLDHMRLHANTLGQSWVRGLRRASKLYA